MPKHPFFFKILLPLLLATQIPTASVKAQKSSDSTAILFYISPAFSFLRLNGKTVIDFNGKNQPVEAQVTPGDYPIEIWAHGFLLKRDTVRVQKSGERVVYKKALKEMDPDFVAFRKSKDDVLGQFAKRITLDAAMGALVVGGSVFAFTGSKVADEKRNLELSVDAYQRAITQPEIASTKNEVDRAQKDYIQAQKDRNLRQAIGISTAVVAATVGIFAVSYQKKHPLEMPVYTGKNPFVLAPLLDFTPGSYCGAGFSIRF